MDFDFDQIVERRNTDCTKWDHAPVLFESPDVLPMWVADMDFAAPPVALAAIEARMQHGVFGYVKPSERYYAAVIDWMARRHQFAVSRTWVDTSPGVVPALGTLVRALTEVGDAVIIQPPVYPPFAQVVEQNDRKLVLNPLIWKNDRYEMDLEDFAQKVTAHHVRLLILCSPHNPVGRVWTKAELRALGDVCKRHGVIVIADEIHADLVLPGSVHTPFASLPDHAAFTATCVAPSKTFNIAGLQAAFTIIADDHTRERYQAELHRSGYYSPNVIGMAAAQAVYEEGDTWLDALLIYLEQNVQLIDETIRRDLPSLRFVRPEGTYLAWFDCRALGLSRDELTAFFRHKARVGINDGHTFGDEGDGFIRLNFGCPRSVLKEGLARIATALTTLRTLT